jgi:nitrous oxide reductase accessory protein NosL
MSFIAVIVPAYGQTGADIGSHKSCKYCGMDREKYGHARMLIEYEDGTSAGLCSLHCAAVELAESLDKAPKSIKVADLNTKQLVDAESAIWVLDGSRPGIMTKRGKWAFARKKDADAFVKEYGGKIVTFDDAIKAAYEDMYQDTKMIREKRKARNLKMQGVGKQH